MATNTFVLYPQNSAFVNGKAAHPPRLSNMRPLAWALIAVSLLPILITPNLLAVAAWTSFMPPDIPLNQVDWGHLPFAVWLLGAVALILNVLMLYILWRVIASFRLSARGQIVNGTLTEIHSYHNPIEKADRRDSVTLVVRYEFTSPKSGRTLTGKGRELRLDMTPYTPLPKPGTPVAVLYLNDGRYRML